MRASLLVSALFALPALRTIHQSPVLTRVCAVTLAGYLHYVISMVNEICAYLKIPCLTIRKVAD